MKEIFQRGVNFVRKNPTILYSLLLIVVMTSIVFFNAYYSLGKFQQNVDSLLQSKAVLAEDIFNITAVALFDNQELLQQKIEFIKNKDSEIQSITVLIPAEKRDEFKIIASSDKQVVGVVGNSDLPLLAWQHDDVGIAFLKRNETGRFWNIVKVVKNEQNEKIGLISMEVSLAENDLFIKDTINKVYFSAIISMLVVLLLVLNHIRLFGYAAKAVKLEEVDKMKDDFISMASHELKSPLTAIRGYAELMKDSLELKENNQNKQDQHHYIDNISASVERLNSLVGDLLEVSKIEQNRLSIKLEDIDISLIIKQIVDEMRVIADQKGLVFINNMHENVKVFGDNARIKQIVVNLISNALKYTPKGKVEISCKEDKGYILITVADTGLGISAEGIKNLFSKFYRVKTEETSKISGTGLGLWISKEVAMKMGGDISVESMEGIGSHFIFKLKKAQEKNV